MKTLAELDTSIHYLNNVIEDKGRLPYYTVEPIAGTDKYTLWLITPHNDHKICTSDSATMYASIAAIRRAEQAN